MQIDTPQIIKSKFYTFLLAKKDLINPVYYLPHDILEIIYKEYLKSQAIDLTNPSMICESPYYTEYVWLCHKGYHREYDQPARVLFRNAMVKCQLCCMQWNTNGKSIRKNDKPCHIGWDIFGKIISKQWDDGTPERRQNGLPCILEFDGVNVICKNANKLQIKSFKLSDIPIEYGWV